MKKIIKWLEENSALKLLAIAAVVVGALITIGSFGVNIKDYLYNNVLTAKNISDKTQTLFAGESLNFFKQQLGAEKIQRNVSNKYTEYVFQYKGSYIQALVENTTDDVIYWAITYCGNIPVVINRPMFHMALTSSGANVLRNPLLLNRSTIASFFNGEKGDFEYFVSGATANSYAYESLYLGNPSAYQTIIVGENDICPSISDLYDHLNDFATSSSDIESFRKTGRINTYGETSPFGGDIVLKLLANEGIGIDPYITFGVDRISIRYFQPY